MLYNEDMNSVRVCVPVCACSLREMESEIVVANKLCDIVELRFDCLEPSEMGNAFDLLESILESQTRPVIITFRPAEQGGRREISIAQRKAFWTQIKTVLKKHKQNAAAKHYVDLEFADGFAAEKMFEFADIAKVICSHHDFSESPPELQNLYERMSSTGASVIKIAVTARDATDCIEVFRLLGRARREQRELIALAMGEAGLLTRVLGPSRGAFLTFASSEAGRETARGQITADDLEKIFRLRSIDKETLITGIIGSPVSHSLSPQIHNAGFAATRLNAVYLPIEVARLDDFMRRMANPRTREIEWHLRGFSVTAPHKTGILKNLDWIEPKANEIGAINTVVIEGAELRGYNTDADAALVPLRNLLSLKNAKVAVIGAGGAARALLWGLRQSGSLTTLFARDPERAKQTAERFGATSAVLSGAKFDGFDVVINATPLGTRGKFEEITPATAQQLRGARFAYDLVYNPEITLFMREALQAGCQTIGGLSMLVEQAAGQFKLWTKQAAPVNVMREAVK